MDHACDVLDLVSDMKAKGVPFALATVVRTVAATAVKAGAKAVIRADGTISDGWIGGGCARAAVLKAAQEAIADGQPRLVSVQPPDSLAEQGLQPGDERGGVRFAKNMCPSQGTMDVFVEAVLPRPELIICGGSPVAVTLADLARRVGFFITVCAREADHWSVEAADRRVDGFTIPQGLSNQRYVVVSTQGRGDEAALHAAVAADADYCAFVGSARKAAALRANLAEQGVAAERLERVKAPAGIDLGAITPEEIALSILAEIVALRRRGQRRKAAP